MGFKQFDLTYYYGPGEGLCDREDVFSDMAAAGITLAQIRNGADNNKRALVHCAKYGIRANVSDKRLDAAILATPEECDRLVREVCEEYLSYEALVGFDISDEPKSDEFDGLGRVVDALHRYAPECETVINLFPNYAMPEQLGNPDYETHLREFISRVRPDFLSYDHYHFLTDEEEKKHFEKTGDEREELIRQNAHMRTARPGFFENAEIIRRFARENDLYAMQIVLLVKHGPYRDLARAELSWEAGMCLAYGFRRVSYFTYGLPTGDDDFWHWDEAMIDADGNKCRHYFDVQAISKWLLPLGRHLFSLDCERVVHTADRSEIGHGRVRRILGDAVVGCYSDGSCLVVNKDYEKEQTVTVEADTLERYIPEEDRFVPCEKSIILDAGECVLLR